MIHEVFRRLEHGSGLPHGEQDEPQGLRFPECIPVAPQADVQFIVIDERPERGQAFSPLESRPMAFKTYSRAVAQLDTRELGKASISPDLPLLAGHPKVSFHY